MRLLVISILSLFISGCALLTPVNTKTTLYTIDQMPEKVPRASKHPVSLLVLMPEASAVYNTTKMAYSLQPHVISYYGKNQWGGMPAQMIQPLIVGTIQNTNYFQAVFTPPLASDATYTLRTQLLELLQDYTVKPAVLRMTVRVTLMNTINNQAVATATFPSVFPMQQNTAYAGVLAANQATASSLRRISEFIITTLKNGQ